MDMDVIVTLPRKLVDIVNEIAKLSGVKPATVIKVLLATLSVKERK